MNTRIVTWSMTFLSVFWLAGCGSDRCFRWPWHNSGCCGGCSGGRCGAENRSYYQKMHAGLRPPISTNPSGRVVLGPDQPWTGDGGKPRILSTPVTTYEKGTLPRPAPSKTPLPVLTTLPPVTSSETKVASSEPRKESPGIGSLPLPLPGSDRGVPLQTGDSRVVLLPNDPPKIDRVDANRVLNDALNSPDSLNKLGIKTDPGEKAIALQSTHIRYGQAENFKQITGKVEQYRKTWRLRYGVVEADDPYGGVVLLDNINGGQNLRDGQHVRVRGTLIPPQNRQESARYLVQGIDVLD
jgi:hypothetical protein